MSKLIIPKTLNFVLVWLNVFGRVKSVDPLKDVERYFCEDNGNYGGSSPAKLRDKYLNNAPNADLETEEEIVECRIHTDSLGTHVNFKILGDGSNTKNSTTLYLADGAIKLKNIQDDTIISLTRLLSQRHSKLLFKQSIALDTATTNEGAAYTQYILVSENSEQKVKKLTLIKCTNDAQECWNGKSKNVVKIDHLGKVTPIVFYADSLDSEQIFYTIPKMKSCTADDLDAKNPSQTLSQEEKQDLFTKIENGKIKCASYPSEIINKLSDSCPDVPDHSNDREIFTIINSSGNKTVTTYSSTYKSKICYTFEIEEFEWEALLAILIVGIAVVVFFIFLYVCWWKKKCCFQESNTAPPSPQGENPMSVARFQNHQSNDRHNGANRPAVEVQADQEDIVLSRVSVSPIDEDEYARENEVQPDHVDEEYVSDSESQKNDGSESQKNDV